MSIYPFRAKSTTDPRVISSTNKLPGASVAASAFNLLAFTGKNGAGACTLTGAKVGDSVVGVVSITDGTTASANFETTITVANQIQQSSATDLSTKKFATTLIVRS